jgi:hypothetical protein
MAEAKSRTVAGPFYGVLAFRYSLVIQALGSDDAPDCSATNPQAKADGAWEDGSFGKSDRRPADGSGQVTISDLDAWKQQGVSLPIKHERTREPKLLAQAVESSCSAG